MKQTPKQKWPHLSVIELTLGVVGILATAYLAQIGLGYHSVWPGVVGVLPTLFRIAPKIRIGLIQGTTDD